MAVADNKDAGNGGGISAYLTAADRPTQKYRDDRQTLSLEIRILNVSIADRPAWWTVAGRILPMTLLITGCI